MKTLNFFYCYCLTFALYFQSFFVRYFFIFFIIMNIFFFCLVDCCLFFYSFTYLWSRGFQCTYLCMQDRRKLKVKFISIRHFQSESFIFSSFYFSNTKIIRINIYTIRFFFSVTSRASNSPPFLSQQFFFFTPLILMDIHSIHYYTFEWRVFEINRVTILYKSKVEYYIIFYFIFFYFI